MMETRENSCPKCPRIATIYAQYADAVERARNQYDGEITDAQLVLIARLSAELHEEK